MSSLKQLHFRYLFNVIKIVDFRRESSMNTQELLVHKRGEWQTVEGLHARVVHALSVLDFTLLFECEVFGQMATFVVPAK